MALQINVDDLLRQRKVESNSIRSICTSANNFDNIGGGYIVVGLEEEN